MRISTLSLLLILSSIRAYGQSVNFKSFIEEYLITFPTNTEVSIGIIDGVHSYKLGYTVENGTLVETDNQEMLFEVASISKVFTATLLMKEQKLGSMALSDPIQKHLLVKMSKGSFQGQTITMQHLVTHTSGLEKNPLRSYKRYNLYLKSFELDYVPGLKWEYNNLTMSLLGALIADKNKTTWDDHLTTNLLQPLGMQNTFADLDKVPAIGRVQCTKKNGEKKDCYFHPLKSFIWPAGSMVSTLNDMMKWLKANLDLQSLSPDLQYIHDTHDQLADSVPLPWFKEKYSSTQGIGWWHYKSGNNRYLCHGGNSPAQTSFIAFDKTRGRGIVILTNVGGRELMNEDKIMKTTDLAIQVLDM